jgi:predicted metal-dependent HD superfamily phosphohydrolase
LTIGDSEETRKALRIRWDATWRMLGAEPRPATTFDGLVAAYSDAGRYYHTLTHLEECFSHFGSAKPLAQSPGEIEIAIWFHDAIYDTHRNDNEENSAAWAAQVTRDSRLSGEIAERIAGLILATKHRAKPDSADGSLFVDVDLSILGSSTDRFDQYEKQIRLEYAWVPEQEFRTGRAKLLRDISKRERIYATEFFQNRLEAAARTNLNRSLAKLES